MKFLINKKRLEGILTDLQPFLAKKDTSAITSHILIEAKEDILILTATDYEIGLKATTDSAIIDNIGVGTVNGDKFMNIIKRLNNADILIEANENELKIKQGRSNFKLPMFNAGEFPSFPNTEVGEKIEINNSELLKAIKQILPTVDTNNPKYELNGALIDIKENQINIAATDTKRLSIVRIDNNTNLQKEIIVHKKALIEIQKIFSSDIEIITDETNLIIKSKNDTFFTKLINGKFPNYERIIPQEIKHRIELPKRETTEAIKLISAVSNEMVFSFENNNLSIKNINKDGEIGEANTDIELNESLSEGIKFGINSKYLSNFMNHIDDETFTLNVNSGDAPLLLTSNNFQTIIMPINL